MMLGQFCLELEPSGVGMLCNITYILPFGTVLKMNFFVVNNNSIWLLGNGENINFWNDSWC